MGAGIDSSNQFLPFFTNQIDKVLYQVIRPAFLGDTAGDKGKFG